MTPAELIALDKAHFWHPFTRMAEWCAPEHEPVLITSASGVWLTDQHGRKGIDGNSTIWTCIHGHGHPRLLRAVRDQFERAAHVSALGFTHEPGIRLAAELCALWPEGTLTRVFYTDDGSTAIECALKMAVQYRQQTGEPERVQFAAFHLAYHGDTMGAAALGGIDIFHARFRSMGMDVLMLDGMESLRALPQESVRKLNAIVIEPLIQGAAGMRTWPAGMLRELRDWCDTSGVFLIADEVMTGFGRTGRMFACQHEEVVPDFLCLAKGLTGGVMPLAATLTTERVFRAFLNEPGGPDRTFYYGHSFSGHPAGCAAALENLAIFREERTLEQLPERIAAMVEGLRGLQETFPHNIRAVRQCGMIAGIDLADGAVAFPPEALTGSRVCVAARAHGLFTRPVRDTLVFMPPLVISLEEIRMAFAALAAGIRDVLGDR